MPEPGDLRGDGLDRRRNLDVDGHRRVDGPANAQAGRVPTGRRQEGLEDLGPIGIAGQVPAHRIEAEGGVGDRPRDHAAGAQPRPVLTKDRAAGNPSPRWLQPDHAATRGRDTDRTTAIAAMTQRAEAGGDRRRGAARGTAGRPGLIDRITSWGEHRTLRHRPGAELGCIGLSQNGGALVLQATNGEAVELCDRLLEDQRPEAVAIAGKRCRFLDGDRNTLEQAQ